MRSDAPGEVEGVGRDGAGRGGCGLSVGLEVVEPDVLLEKRDQRQSAVGQIDLRFCGFFLCLTLVLALR